MRLAQTAYDFSASDRFGLALFASILAHMVVILGVSFTAPRIQLPGAETLEITLVQTRSNQAPANPQFLAQANQDGGGTADARDVARSPLPVMEMSDQNDRMPLAQPAPQKPVASLRDLVALFTQADAERRVRSPEPQPEKKEERATPERMGLPQRQTRETERVRLNAEIDRHFSEMQKLPRHTYINARTQEYEFATYMDGWRAKVEKVGNLNYPSEAKREKLGGSLVLDVSINPDGSVHDVQVVRPSHHRVLDDAAVRIVQLAGPFAPLPPEIRARTDILHITRTWVFRDTDLRTE
ncbi:MAG: TonB family protein [Chromatiales bacterium]|nr:TonB family protein [Chromatiales bacterium]